MAHDETNQCLVGDVVRIEPTPAFTQQKKHAVAEIVRPVDRYVDPVTKFVYTNGHLNIPVGYAELNEDGKETIVNRVPKEMYKQMGLL